MSSVIKLIMFYYVLGDELISSKWARAVISPEREGERERERRPRKAQSHLFQKAQASAGLLTDEPGIVSWVLVI